LQDKEDIAREAIPAQLADDVIVRTGGLGSARGPRPRPGDHPVGGRRFDSRPVPPVRLRLPGDLDPLQLPNPALHHLEERKDSILC